MKLCTTLLVFWLCLFGFDGLSFAQALDPYLEQRDSACVFCKIIDRIEPAKILAENEHIIIFKSRSGHPLIVPKKHIKDLKELEPPDHHLFTRLLEAAQKLSTYLIKAQDFQLRINTGAGAGQTVFHLHVHFISPSQLMNTPISI